MYKKTAVHTGIIMSISINKYSGKHPSRRGNFILIVLILSIKNIFIVDAKVQELVYYGNTVLFLLPSRECMRENNFFWSPSQSMTLCSMSSDFLLEMAFFTALQLTDISFYTRSLFNVYISNSKLNTFYVLKYVKVGVVDQTLNFP